MTHDRSSDAKPPAMNFCPLLRGEKALGNGVTVSGAGSDAIRNAGLLLLGAFPSVWVNVVRLMPTDGKTKRPGVDCGVDDGSPMSTFRRFGDDGR